MKKFLLALVILTGSATVASAADCYPIKGNWVNAATKNCHEETPGASYGGGPDVIGRPKCQRKYV